MVAGIIGRKIGMTQVFSDDGVVSPATVLQAGPCVVVQRKTVDRDGYEAVQIGLVEPRRRGCRRRSPGTTGGACRRPDPARGGFGDGAEAPQEGEQVLVSLFRGGDSGRRRRPEAGARFQGVIKRTARRRARHARVHCSTRRPGSMGSRPIRRG